MLKINPIRTIALATALTAGTAVMAQNNRLQERQRQFLTEEFRKADTNPQDFFVSQDELNTYMGNSDTQVSDFDSTKDGLLNIDEFSSIVTGKKVTQQTQPTSQAQTTNVQNNQTQRAPFLAQQPQAQRTTNVQAQKKQQEVKQIVDNLRYYEKYYWDNASAFKPDYPNCEAIDVVNTVKRINADNMVDVAKALGVHNNGELINKLLVAKHAPSDWHNYKCFIYSRLVLDHINNVFSDYLNKHPEKNFRHQRELVNQCANWQESFRSPAIVGLHLYQQTYINLTQ